MKGTHWLQLIPLALFAGPVAGQMTAAEVCERALVPESIPWVVERLDRSGTLLAAGNLAEAEPIVRDIGGFPRSADVSVSTRCLGDDISRRIFATRQKLALALGSATEAAIAGQISGAMTNYGKGGSQEKARSGALADQISDAVINYAKGGAIDKARSLGSSLPADSPQFKNLVRQLAAMGDWTPSMSAGGDIPPLPEQTALFEKYQGLAHEFSSILTSAARLRLAEEMAVMNAPVTATEESMLKSQRMGEAIMAAITRSDVGEGKRFPIEIVRGTTSLRMVREAENMFVAANEDPAPALARAVQRGDQMVALAEDESVTPEARASIHRYAIDFYRIGRDEAKQRRAEGKQPYYDQQMEEEMARRKAQAETAAVELEKSAAEVREATARMQKTEAEKKAFADEAAALEKELDF